MFRHEFRRTPLSAAVPLEGSDTVVGLRELENRQRREALQSLFGAANGVPARAAMGQLESAWDADKHCPCNSRHKCTVLGLPT